MLPSALPMGLEPNESSDKTAAGCRRVAAMCGVQLSSATEYANTKRRFGDGEGMTGMSPGQEGSMSTVAPVPAA